MSRRSKTRPGERIERYSAQTGGASGAGGPSGRCAAYVLPHGARRGGRSEEMSKELLATCLGPEIFPVPKTFGDVALE